MPQPKRQQRRSVKMDGDGYESKYLLPCKYRRSRARRDKSANSTGSLPEISLGSVS